MSFLTRGISHMAMLPFLPHINVNLVALSLHPIVPEHDEKEKEAIRFPN